QPKVYVRSGRVEGAEALLRWVHPTKGTISPIDFIPVLETSGMILEVGQWVLEEACKTLVRWHEQGLWREGMRLSINISPRQFRLKAIVDDVLRTLAAYAIPSHSLEMEITEGRSEEHTSELQSRENLVCRLLLEKNNEKFYTTN